jgi:hypothetical protein
VTEADHHGQGDYGEVGLTSEEPDSTTEELEGGHEWNFEAELVKWSKLD